MFAIGLLFSVPAIVTSQAGASAVAQSSVVPMQAGLAPLCAITNHPKTKSVQFPTGRFRGLFFVSILDLDGDTGELAFCFISV